MSDKDVENIRVGPYRVKPGPYLYLGLLTAYCLARLALVWDVELGKDEAAYWYWGRHLDATYALLPFALIGLAHLLLPGHEWFLRLPSILAGAGAAALMFRLCRLYGLSAERALWAAAVLALSHWMWHATSYLHPDAFFVLCWLMALVWARQALDAPSDAAYLRLGAAIGLCLLCKYSAAFLAVGLFLYLWIALEGRLRWRALAAAGLACGLVALPLAWAQLSTGFYLPTTLSTLSRIVEDQPLPLRLGLFLVNPLTFVSPVLLVALYYGLYRLARTARGASSAQLLALLPALCLFAGFAYFALSRGQIKGNWILPGFLGLWPLVFASWSRRWLMVAVFIGLLQAGPIAVGLQHPGLAARLLAGGLDASYKAMVSTPDQQREPSYSWTERLCEYHAWDALAAATENALNASSVAPETPLLSTQYGTVFAHNYYADRPIYTVDDMRFRFLTDFHQRAVPRPEQVLFIVRRDGPLPASLTVLYRTTNKLASLPRPVAGCAPVFYDLYLLGKETQ